MQKRYQIFVSSTFVDLKEERIEVMQLLLKNNFIPAGMELFPATNEEQFSYIKKIIEQSDYYVLIIAGRYGSCDESGISYTEKEYDYAVENNISVIAFIHENVENLPRSKTESDQTQIDKLNKFIKKVSTGRLIQKWNDASDLQLKLSASLLHNITNSSAIGWVRGDSVSSSQQINEINSLLKENKELKEKLSSESQTVNLDKTNKLNHEYTIMLYENLDGEPINDIKITWLEIFKIITFNYIDSLSEENIFKDLNSYLCNEYHGEFDKNYLLATLRNQFRGLDLIDDLYKDDQMNDIVWSLSTEGKELVKSIHLI